MISRTIVSASIIINHNFDMHDSYIEKYALYNYFKYVYANLRQDN